MILEDLFWTKIQLQVSITQSMIQMILKIEYKINKKMV